MAQDFADGVFAAIASFYAIIHMPLDEHPELFRRIAARLEPGGWLLAIVGYEAWTGTEDEYLDQPGGLMAWSHADEADEPALDRAGRAARRVGTLHPRGRERPHAGAGAEAGGG